MYEYSFLVNDIIKEFPENELEDDLYKDFCSFFDTASLPLCHLGVVRHNDLVILYTDNCNYVERIEHLVGITSRASDILDYVTRDKIDIDNIGLCEARLYYCMFQSIGGDDTCFDYHGTFVQVVLDAILAVAKKDADSMNSL